MLHVAIAGAGVTGLTTAFAFARNGHKVDVYERKTEDVFANEGGAGIQLQPNAMRILDTWGVDVSAVGHTSGGVLIRRYTGESLGTIAPAAGSQTWVIRSDFRRTMLSEALAQGVKIHFGVDIVGIDASRPALLFKDGIEAQFDLIVGSDGIRSRIRELLFPSVKPEVQQHCTYQMQLPFQALSSDLARQIINDPIASLTLGPGTYIVMSPVPSRQILDLQFFQTDDRSEADAEKWYTFIPDMTQLRHRYRDNFGGIVPEALTLGKGVWKWTVAECFAPSWISGNGRVILGGDAVHAMLPASGQGAGMCIEDAAVLSELFRHASPHDGERIEALANLYQQLRKPRTDRCHQRAKDMNTSNCLPDGEMQRKRDAALRKAQEKKARSPIEGDPNAHPMSHEFDNWLEQYDAIKEARDAIRRAGLSDPASKL